MLRRHHTPRRRLDWKINRKVLYPLYRSVNVSDREPFDPLRWLVALSAGMALLASLHYARGELADDAFISFRYARNLVEGHGLVFNPGERVEGYTNFLWVLLVAGGLRLGIPAEWTAPALGIVSGVATILVVASLNRSAGDRFCLSSVTAAMLLASNFFFHLWSAHGLETSLFALLVALGLRSDLRAVDSLQTVNSALWYGLATLVRPEGIFLFLASLAATALGGGPEIESRPLWRRIGLYLCTAAPFFVWRITYYGYPFPNTFYAKLGVSGVGLAHGASYVCGLIFDPHSVILLFLLPAVTEAYRTPRMRVTLVMLFTYLAVVIGEGGDFSPGFRFLAPAMPMLYVAVAEGISATVKSSGIRLWPRPLIVLSAVLLLGTIAWHSAGTFVWAEQERRSCDVFVRRMKMAAATLREHMPSSTSIALNPVGAIPYYTRFYTFDMLGLTNEHIAHTHPPDMGSGQIGHEKGDGSYILAQRPDLILIGNVFVADRSVSVPDALAAPWKALFRSEVEIVSRPDLPDLYVRDVLPLADGSHLLFLRRRDFMPERLLFPDRFREGQWQASFR